MVLINMNRTFIDFSFREERCAHCLSWLCIMLRIFIGGFTESYTYNHAVLAADVTSPG